MDKKRIEEIRETWKDRNWMPMNPHADIKFLLSTIEKLETSHDDWKKNWQLGSAALHKCEERVKELETKNELSGICEICSVAAVKRVEQAESNLNRLLEAVERHKDDFYSAWPEDRLLYQTAEGIRNALKGV